MFKIFKKRNPKEEVALLLWRKLKLFKFRSQIHEFVREKTFSEKNWIKKDIWEGLYKPMDIQKTYYNVHELCLEMKIKEKELAKKCKPMPLIEKIIRKLFKKTVLAIEIDAMGDCYTVGDKEETYHLLSNSISKKTKQWSK